MYWLATLNNLAAPCNSSPTFLNPAVPYFCLGTNVFNSSGVDPDGDSLAYELYVPMTGATTTVTYAAGYSLTDPLGPCGSTSFDPTSGILTINATCPVTTVIGIRIKEFRNEVLIGTVHRDVQLVILNCTNSSPLISDTSGTFTGDTTINLNGCLGPTISFCVSAMDPDGNNITFSQSGINSIPAATYTITNNSTPNPQFCFSWTPTPADVRPQPYVFTLSAQDNACPNSSVEIRTFRIFVRDSVVADMVHDTSGCMGTPLTFQATNIAGASFPVTVQWTGGGGLNLTGNPVSYSYSSFGTFPVYMALTDARGCQFKDTGSVSIYPSPQVTISPPSPFLCGPDTIYVNATSTSIPASSWSWSPSSGLSCTNCPNPLAYPSTTTTYEVVATSANGCLDTAYYTIQVVSLPNATFTGPTSMCSAGIGLYTANSGGLSYQWSVVGNGVIVGPSTNQSVTVQGGSAGSFTLKLVVTDPVTGCVDSSQQVITVHPLPNATFTGPTSMCSAGIGLYTANSGGLNYQWSVVGNGMIVGPSTGQSVTVQGGNAGSFTLKLVVTDPVTGCVDSSRQVITVHPLPNATFTGPASVCLRGMGVYTANGAGLSYQWSVVGNGMIVGPNTGPSVTVRGVIAVSFT
jgi:hypothetical protein